MKQVNVYEARGQFSRLLDEAVAGEDVVIARNGRPIVRLVPIAPRRRRLGRWQGAVAEVSDEAWHAADLAAAALFEQRSK